MNQAYQDSAFDGVRRWLGVVYWMVALMVLVGGITRLTGSGLSMVTWKPVMGLLPPLTDADWQALFEQYKSSPQYVKVNYWMTIDDFKPIFFWEYIHRVLGRLIGMVFFLPWLWFTVRGILRGRLAVRAFVAFILGGLQGLLGWYMVKSGLVDVPEVSHFRLAAHLSLAFFVGMYVLWLWLDLKYGPSSGGNTGVRHLCWGFLALLGLQIVYGAFMAGMKAGLLYRTFPDINGQFAPDGWLRLEPLWLNFLSNPEAIHFIHRLLGWAVAFVGIWLAVKAFRNAKHQLQAMAASLMAGLLIAQFALGVGTVVFGVPTALAAAHQLGAYLLLSVTVVLAHLYRGSPITD